MLVRIALVAVTIGITLGAGIARAQAPSGPADPPAAASYPVLATAAPVLWQPSMNVFRRFAAAPEKMYEFYGPVLGFEQLQTLSVTATNPGGVARFQAGAQELKLTRRTPNRQYQPGGVTDATGLRLVTFFFADEAALVERFTKHGHSPPKFTTERATGRRSALVLDPDGQTVELVVLPNASPDQLAAIEVGLTVADLERSRAFYRGFAGLEELEPGEDQRFGTKKYSFRHGATTVVLRSFGRDLPADTGSGGIQYVVSNVDAIGALAQARAVTVETPLSPPGNGLRTIWLSDPDGVTNYFAETAQSRAARHR
jgi:catechol 2,3-dioxygenase-like lactoylglutathione lyase family enzyme